MGIPEWDEIAIPAGFGPCRLLYNPPTETVIAELQSVGEEFHPNQIYARKRDASRYEPIQDEDPMISSESAVVALGRPFLFYLSNKLTKVDQHYDGDWQCLYCFDLEKRTKVRIAEKGSLRLPSPNVEGWITRLVDVSADASELYLSIGMMPPDVPTGVRMVNHQLARMDLPTGDIHLVSTLRGAFF